jgi:hypothetical protein
MNRRARTHSRNVHATLGALNIVHTLDSSVTGCQGTDICTCPFERFAQLSPTTVSIVISITYFAHFFETRFFFTFFIDVF